jgi:PAS domain S-box-containing protein
MSPNGMGFEHLLEAVPDALVGIDQEGVIRFVNRQTEALFGCDRDRLIGQPIETLVPEPLWQIYAQHRQDYFADPRTRSSGLDLELSGRRQDGTEFPVNVSLSHIDTGDVLLVVTAVRDVARRRQAIKNAQLLASIVESSDDAIISGTSEGIITSWNPAAVRIYGYSREEIIGRSASILMPEDRVGEMSAIRVKIKAGQVVEHFETNRLRKDGTVVPISLSIAPIFDEHGVVVGTTAIHRDVTRQRQTIELAERMAAIVEGSADAIFGCALDGTIMSWNPAAERMYGYSREEIVGRRAKILTPQDRDGEMLAVLEQIKAGNHVEPLETERTRKDGTVFPVSLTISPVRDSTGAVVGTSVIHRDRTEQRVAFERAQHLASIVESSDDAIISRSLDGRITSWNPAAERMYGYSCAEVIGRPDEMTTLKSRVGEVEAVLEQIDAGQHAEHLETKRVRKNGSVFPVSLTISPVCDAGGTVVGTSVIHRDLTEQKGALASAERLAAIVEYADEAIIGRTLDGIVTSWNPAAERMFGYRADEIVGESIDRLSPENRAGDAISILARISAGLSVDDYETRRVRKDGAVFPVSLTISPIRDASGTVVSASVICRDQSELKRAAQYARGLIEADPDPLGMVSPDGTVLDVNEATVRATGIPRDQLIGSDFAQYWTDPEAARQGIAWAFKHGSLTDGMLTARHDDGTLTDYLCNATVYRDITGEVLGVLTSARDVTRQTLARAAMAKQQAKELERLEELELFRELTLGRELKMIELKKELEYLRQFGPADRAGSDDEAPDDEG